MGSTRLPGKVMKRLAGETVLARVLARCAMIEGLDAVCCAVPVGAADDPVADEAHRNGCLVVRGSEDDVLARYAAAAAEIGADVVLRVTADCPLLDPGIAAGVLRLAAETGVSYTANSLLPTWPHGLDCEAIPAEWLHRAAGEATDPHEREHVTPFVRTHPDAGRANLVAPVPHLAAHRWTLDTVADLEFLCAVFERLRDPAGAGWETTLAAIRSEPKLVVDATRAGARTRKPTNPEDVVATLARDGGLVRLRPASTADSPTMFEWQSDPRTRRHFRDSAAPTRSSHDAWLAARLDDPKRRPWIVLHDGRPAGVLRLDPVDGGAHEVSILVEPERYRLGIGRAALALARTLRPEVRLRAEVRPGNEASAALFQAAGYVANGSDWYVNDPEQAA